MLLEAFHKFAILELIRLRPMPASSWSSPALASSACERHPRLHVASGNCPHSGFRN